MSEMTPEPQLAPELPAHELVVATPAGVTTPRNQFGRSLIAGIVAAVILASGGGIGIGWNLAHFISNHSSAATQSHVSTVAPQGSSSGNANLDINAITRKVSPAVVDINTTIQTAGGTGAAAGTGLIMTSSGDVLTNNHVVESSTSVKVSIQGRSGTYTADVIGVDPTDDIAVIHIRDVSGLPTATFANSSSIQVGDTVFALGNALGMGGAPRVTQGTVTALDQSITASDNGAQAEQLTGMIQSDAEISPGDSGGALVNSAGQVIGIITAGEAQGFRSTSTTVAFAIPASKAVDVANRILDGDAGNGVFIGPVGYLGVAVQDLGDGSGVQVRSVQAGSPAEQAGITAGSVITAIDSTAIDSATALGNALHQHKPGDQVKVTWTVGTATHSATVTLTTGPTI